MKMLQIDIFKNSAVAENLEVSNSHFASDAIRSNSIRALLQITSPEVRKWDHDPQLPHL
jgi:hypothetical protein